MSSYNRIIMIGNLTRDPDLRQQNSGRSVCRLSMASNRQFKNKQTGQATQEVCFVDIDVWGAQAESCYKYLQKGRSCLVEGRLKFDTWQDAEGQKHSKHSIVADRITFLSSNQATEEDSEPKFSASHAAPQKVETAPQAPKREESFQDVDPFKGEDEGFEDDLPF